MTHADIIARLTAATGPDQEIDAAIMASFYDRGERIIGTHEQQEDGSWKPIAVPVWIDRSTSKWVSTHAFSFTASLDATVALIERELPGWTIAGIGQDDCKKWHASLQKGHRTSYSTVALAGAPTSAIALLLALFKALEAQETHHG
jgi:hypothetical protein